MSKRDRTTIWYDGPAFVRHVMDVQDFAPALLALADTIELANHKFNGSQENMQAQVTADVELRCFMIDISWSNLS